MCGSIAAKEAKILKNNKYSDKIAIILISGYLLIPLILTFLYSIFNEWTHILPSGMTFHYYQEILQDSLFLQSLLRSLIIAIIPVLICSLIMIMVFYVILFSWPALDKYIEILCTIPYSLQGIILAIGIISLYGDLPGLLSDRVVLLVGTYCIIVLPYIYRGIKNSLQSLHTHTLIDAATMLGATKSKTFLQIILPELLPGIAVSMIISMAMIFADFVIVNIIAGGYYQTSSIYLYKMMAKSGQLTSAIIVILFMTTLVMSLIITAIRKKMEAVK